MVFASRIISLVTLLLLFMRKLMYMNSLAVSISSFPILNRSCLRCLFCFSQHAFGFYAHSFRCMCYRCECFNGFFHCSAE